MNKNDTGELEQLLRLEEAILKNEALMKVLCSKWLGKPELIGKDVQYIALTIHKANMLLDYKKLQ